jgi:hypothetical protein
MLSEEIDVVLTNNYQNMIPKFLLPTVKGFLTVLGRVFTEMTFWNILNLNIYSGSGKLDDN